jgi:hypothetical protein
MSKTFPFDKAQFSAIELFFQRSWFERLWIWQKLRLACHDPVVLCGARELPWESICDFIYCMRMKPKVHYSDDFRVQRIPMLSQLCNRAYKSHPDDFVRLIQTPKN